MSASHTFRPSLVLPLDEATLDEAAFARSTTKAVAAPGPLSAPAGPVGPLAFAGTGGPSVVIAPTTLGRTGAEIRVNTTTADSQTTPMIVTLSNGSFAVVWTDFSDGGHGRHG